MIVALWVLVASGSEFYLSVAGAAIVYSVAAVGQGLLIGRTGQVSLGGAALMAVGAYATALSTRAGAVAAFPIPLLIAGVAGAVVGAIVAVPGLRFKGLYLLLATLALQFVVQFGTERLEHRSEFLAGVTVQSAPGSALVSTGRPVAETSLVVLILVYIGVKAAYRGHPGRVLSAISENEVAAAAMGINVRRWKVAAFVVSSAVTAVAGGLFAYYIGVVTSASFDLTLAITLLIMTFLGGAGAAGGPIIGATVITVFPYVTNSLADRLPSGSWLGTNMPYLQVVVYGVALAVVLLYARAGLAGIDVIAPVRLLARLRARGPEPGVTARSETADPVTASPEPVDDAGGLLSVSELTVRYRGGVMGVNRVAFGVEPGEIVAIVGRNGAGKTSLLRGIVGTVRSDDFAVEGNVTFDGDSLDGVPAPGRVARGVVYVPEQTKVFPGLSVLDHFALVGAKPAQVVESLEKANLTPLKSRLNSPAGLLSGGERQFLALATAMLRTPKLLLVDEMSLGLAPIAITHVIDAIARIREFTGAGVVVVDQNVAVLSRIADRIIVIENGRIAWQGRPDAMNIERIESAYFGLHREVRNS